MAVSHQQGRITWTLHWMNIMICILLLVCVFGEWEGGCGNRLVLQLEMVPSIMPLYRNVFHQVDQRMRYTTKSE